MVSYSSDYIRISILFHQLGPSTIYRSYEGYELDQFLHAFEGKPFYFEIRSFKEDDSDEDSDATRYSKPFEGYVRNVTIDGHPQEVDPNGFNGTAIFRDCPKALQFGSNGGSVLLDQNFNVNDKLQAYFELKPKESSNCSALLLSAYSGDSYLIAEIVDNYMFMRMKAGNEHDNLRPYHGFLNLDEGVHVCDGNWHRRMLTDSIYFK